MVLSHRRVAGPRAGFSLLELLAVVSILVVLIGVGGMIYFRYVDDAREQTARAGIAAIETTLNAYKTVHGEYPLDLSVLTLPEDGKPAVLEQRHLLDPWQRPYIYEPANQHPATLKPRIYSQGARPGDPSAVIANW